MEIRELHEIATLYTNIGEAISFVNEHKKSKDVHIALKAISSSNDGKTVRVHLLYEYGDFEHMGIFRFDVDYRRSIMIDDIFIDIAEFVSGCKNECF